MTPMLLVLILLAAILLFWAVGAYNRLVRLRSEVERRFPRSTPSCPCSRP